MTNEMVISPFHHSYSANLCAPYLCYCGVQTTPWIINPPEETLLKHFRFRSYGEGSVVDIPRGFLLGRGGGGLLPDGAVVKLRPVASLLMTGGGVLLRFWTFARFENWNSQRLSRGNLDF